MSGGNKEAEPLTTEALLAGRRFEELSECERELFGKLHKQEAEVTAQRILDNLNSHTATKH